MASIGIEIEILLSLRFEESEIDGTADLDIFARWLVNKFNSTRAQGEFVMQSDIIGEYNGEGENKLWICTDDATLDLTKSSNQCKSLIRHLQLPEQ